MRHIHNKIIPTHTCHLCMCMCVLVRNQPTKYGQLSIYKILETVYISTEFNIFLADGNISFRCLGNKWTTCKRSIVCTTWDYFFKRWINFKEMITLTLRGSVWFYLNPHRESHVKVGLSDCSLQWTELQG